MGKSTLLNRMVGSRVSIVEPTAGVTRDRIAVQARIWAASGERWIEVVDTGGIGIVDRHDLEPQVEEQIRVALLSASVVLWLVDVREGITPLDQEVARRLRGIPVPVMLVVNKVEGRKLEWDVDEFRRMGGFDGPHPISAQNGEGIEDLYARLFQLLPPQDAAEAARDQEQPPLQPVMRMAVIGQRNAGKSTLINALAREERMIVSEVAGTTRDAVDVVFERDGRSFVAIDTAGVRKRKSHEDAIDFFSDARAHKSIRRADVVVLLFDVTRKLSAIDKDLARYAIDHHKPVILGANKWDLVKDLEPEDFRAYIGEQLQALSYAPVAFLSAKEKRGVEDLLALAQELFAQSQLRVSTGELNRVVERAMDSRPPSSQGHSARVLYATQTDVGPPTVVLFVNDKKHFGKDFLRYLGARLRDELPFREIPVRLVLRDRGTPEEAGAVRPRSTEARSKEDSE